MSTDPDAPKQATPQEVQYQYNKYYTEINEKLVREIPMNTIEKTRYSTGDRLELLPNRQRPPPRTWPVVNAWRFASIATKFTNEGVYSDLEEELQARQEKNMVHPSYKYGQSVYNRAMPDSYDLNEAKADQIKAAQAIRDTSIYDTSSVRSGNNFS